MCSRRCSPAADAPPAIVAAEGLAQIDDEARSRRWSREVLAANADAVAQYRAGKTTDVRLSGGSGDEGDGRARPTPSSSTSCMRRIARERSADIGAELPLIEAHHLSKVYSRGVYALRDLSLTHRQGRVRVPDRPERRRQVDAAAPAAAAGRADRGPADRRRPQPLARSRRDRSRRTAAPLGFVFQDFKLIPTQDGLRERLVRAARARHAARRSSSGGRTRC